MNLSDVGAATQPAAVRRSWWRGLNVRLTFFVGLLLGILVPAIFLEGMHAFSQFDRELQLRVRNPLQQYADVLARGVAVAVWSYDTSMASDLLDAVMRNPDVARITVRGHTNTIFLQTNNPAVTDPHPLVESRDITYNRQWIGNLTIEMSPRRVEQQLWRDQLSLLAALAAQVLITFTVVWVLFNRRLMRPLQSLQRDAQRLSRGELSEPVRWERNDEIGALSQTMDSMRVEIASLLEERSSRARQLERELRERVRVENALEHSQLKFSAIFEASPVAMAVVRQDAPHALIDVNTAWTQVFGRSRSQVVGHSEHSLGIWKEAYVHQHAMGLLGRHSELTRFSAWMAGGAGRPDMLCEVSGRTITLGAQTLTILAYDDVTESHTYEENILELNAGLEQRVTDRTQELSQALERLTSTQTELIRAEKMSALGSLVAGIAHELNTPIGNSLTVASTLQDHIRTLEANMESGMRRSDLLNFIGRGREGAGILMRSLQHAAELVASFKQVAVDQTSAKRRVFDLQTAVQDLLLTLGPSLRKSPCQVDHDVAAGITMDSYPGPLGQILTNLINNAIVHAFAGRTDGTVRILAQKIGDGQVRIQVQDNGCGIAPAHLGRVFDPFFTTRLGMGGSGLGLNIVYNLAHTALGGDISVDSTLGNGACFTLLLPCVAPELTPVP